MFAYLSFYPIWQFMRKPIITVHLSYCMYSLCSSTIKTGRHILDLM